MLVLLLAIAIPNSKPCSMPQESPATTTRSLHSTIPSRVQMMLVAYLFVDGFLFCLFVSLLFLSRSWPARPQPATRAWTTSANQMQLGYKSAGTFNEPRTQDTSWSPYTAAGRQARKRKRSGKVKPRAHMSTTCDTKKKNTKRFIAPLRTGPRLPKRGFAGEVPRAVRGPPYTPIPQRAKPVVASCS